MCIYMCVCLYLKLADKYEIVNIRERIRSAGQCSVHRRL